MYTDSTGYALRVSPSLIYASRIEFDARLSEDLNGNGVLDPGEDRNGNNRLDPSGEDINGNGILDPGEDVNGDRRLNYGPPFNPDSFQVINAGRDEEFGTDDDLSNFWPGTRREYLDSLKK